MVNRKWVGKILEITGVAVILIGFGLTQLRIPLSKEESQILFQNCIECKEPPTYRTLDPTITEGLFFAGFPIIALGLIFRYVI
ncbi:MAG: hypothetical protein ACREA3_10045 [Nitrosotalea sp.]